VLSISFYCTVFCGNNTPICTFAPQFYIVLDTSRSHSYRQSRRTANTSGSASSVDTDTGTGLHNPAASKTDSSSTSTTGFVLSSSESVSGISGLLAADRASSSFATFILPHIELALSRGFDDNVGRIPVSAIFELSTLPDWAAVAEQLHGMFWAAGDSRSQHGFSALKSLTDIDVRFSERCVYNIFINILIIIIIVVIIERIKKLILNRHLCV